jgi:hypothetical protein
LPQNIDTHPQVKYTYPKLTIQKKVCEMKRLIALLTLLLALSACAPPLNLNKTASGSNFYGTYTVSYSDRWTIDIQVGRITFSNDPEGIESYLRNGSVAGEQVAGSIYALPKGAEMTALEGVLAVYETQLGVSFGNRESFNENSRQGLSGTGSQTINGIVQDIGIAVSDVGESFGVVIYVTSVGKVNNPMGTIRRMVSTVNFIPVTQQ